jgi:RimJ/RimL family protein N-acetyltransferase
MIAQFTDNPYPVWDRIRSRLSDDYGNLATSGDFIAVYDEGRMAGAFLIKRWNEHCYEVHGGVHPDYWGRGPEVCELMGRALFAGTPCLKLVAIIPEFNRLMRRCVEKVGMKQEGIVTKSFLKWMKLHDQIVYGVTKGEAKCRQQQ